ncbi:MAG: DNA-directed RNA polymerase subunit alpha [Candidatus Margulisbacteria bacterium]|jgi:DNA-directed RNA polymerase subunit alpha|nr:DNA-directed RNA polymerase subunit alpha [Candidatus Margulisiibacteriota bacterium]
MTNPWVKYNEISPAYGVFTAEPLERGYGTTLGNSLRRILLSSIGGAAVTTVKIEGVDHEFSTIDGIKEDVLDIIANLKNIAVKSYSNVPVEMTISVKGESVVTARDIQHDNEVEIVNPNHHIATVGKGGKLNITLTVEKGVGYILADVSESKKYPIGTMPIDASFSPVIKVNHKVEPARVGKSLDYDKLTLEVWTNGVISPEEAVRQSAQILKNQMDIFLSLNQKPADSDNVYDSEVNKQKNNGLALTIDDLELSARSSNCLKKANINTVSELVDKPLEDLLRIKNFGKKSAEEINNKLAQYGLALKGDISNFDSIEEEDD